MEDRTPPQDIEAEMTVLGAVLIDGDAYRVAKAILDPGDFRHGAHGTIFAAMAIVLISGRWLHEIEQWVRVAPHIDGVTILMTVAAIAGIVGMCLPVKPGQSRAFAVALFLILISLGCLAPAMAPAIKH